MKEFLKRVLEGKLGWKTMVAALMIVAATVGEALGLLTLNQADRLLVLGEAMGFVGLRDALAKIKQ